MRYRLVTDDDAHYYVIEADKAAEWEAWVFSEDAMDGAEPPAWATRLNRPHNFITFADWRPDAD